MKKNRCRFSFLSKNQSHFLKILVKLPDHCFGVHLCSLCYRVSLRGCCQTRYSDGHLHISCMLSRLQTGQNFHPQRPRKLWILFLPAFVLYFLTTFDSILWFLIIIIDDQYIRDFQIIIWEVSSTKSKLQQSNQNFNWKF